MTHAFRPRIHDTRIGARSRDTPAQPDNCSTPRRAACARDALLLFRSFYYARSRFEADQIADRFGRVLAGSPGTQPNLTKFRNGPNLPKPGRT